jgi:sugar diacid utilization regulator
VRHPDGPPPRQLVKTARERGGSGTLVAPSATELVALIPDRDHQRTDRVIAELERHLGEQVWAGVAAQERAAIPYGHQEAADVVELAIAARRAPGFYRLDDFLVEYAVARHDLVSSSLVSIVRPLTSHPVLYETLDALIQADFNRNRAAKNLFIHRSTLDYRLNRTEEVTGYDPMSGQGAQVLGAAMTAHALARSA